MTLDKEAIIEALLFTWGDPLSLKDLSTILELKNSETRKLMESLSEKCRANNRGLQILKIADSYQLTTKAAAHQWIELLNKPTREKSLSNAAMETLSIIAYKQPVIKSEIENIRGVRADGAIRTLVANELIEEKGRMETIGRPIIYGTTDKFLQIFGLEDLTNLPELEETLVFEEEAKKEADEQLKLNMNSEGD